MAGDVIDFLRDANFDAVFDRRHHGEDGQMPARATRCRSAASQKGCSRRHGGCEPCPPAALPT
jgi:hypothetical protein